MDTSFCCALHNKAHSNDGSVVVAMEHIIDAHEMTFYTGFSAFLENPCEKISNGTAQHVSDLKGGENAWLRSPKGRDKLHNP